MTDKEMLELAAKAAGLVCRGWRLPGARSDGWYGMYTGDPDEGSYVRWNPLTDDGDAFRLAVKLSLVIVPSAYNQGENAWGFVGVAWFGQQVELESEKFTDDPYTATRRAIVRAAAEIGKGME